MLDKLTQRIVDSFHRSAKKTIIPVKEVLKHNVNTQMDIGSKALKFGTLILMILGIMKMRDKEDPVQKSEVPSTIIINNYIREGKKGDEC